MSSHPTPQERMSQDAAILFDAFATIRAEHLASGAPASALIGALIREGPATLERLGWGRKRRTPLTFNGSVGLARVRLVEEIYSAVPESVRPRRAFYGEALRAMAGDAAPGAKRSRALTPAEVRFIRREYRPGRGSHTNGSALARLFGVNPGLVHQIVRGLVYRDVPAEEED